MTSLQLKAGPDLLLRPLRVADAKTVFALVAAERAWLRRWLPWLDENTTLDQTKAFIAKMRELERSGLSLTCGLWLKGQLIGLVGFNWIDRANRCGHVGYWLSEEITGRGHMTRAVAALLAHGFGPMKLHRIELRAAVRNRASRAIAKRLGFRHEGTLRQAEHLYGRYVDHAVYGLLAQEWAAR
jgi:ribosomal-protein-serine acetyltransferase